MLFRSQFDLFVKDLTTGQVQGPLAHRVTSAEWAADSATLHFTTEDEQTKRSDTAWRVRPGGTPEKTFQEKVFDYETHKEWSFAGELPCIVDFYADWCGPCKMFGPIFEKAAEAHTDIRFAKVDTENNQELAGGMGIQSIPTIMAFRDGVMLFSQPGAMPAASLDQLIDAIRKVDMDDVRKQIAEAEAANSNE